MPLHQDDLELWKRFSEEQSLLYPEPDLLEVAAYLDGTLDPETNDKIEYFLAVNPASATLMDTTTVESPAAPFDLVSRAEYLVGPASIVATGRPRWRLSKHVAALLAPPTAVAAFSMAAAVLVGLSLGMHTHNHQLAADMAVGQVVAFQTMEGVAPKGIF